MPRFRAPQEPDADELRRREKRQRTAALQDAGAISGMRLLVRRRRTSRVTRPGNCFQYSCGGSGTEADFRTRFSSVLSMGKRSLFGFAEDFLELPARHKHAPGNRGLLRRRKPSRGFATDGKHRSTVPQMMVETSGCSRLIIDLLVPPPIFRR